MSVLDNQLIVGTLGLRSVRIVMRHYLPELIHGRVETRPPTVPWADLQLTLRQPDGAVRHGKISIQLRNLYSVRKVEVAALSELRWCVPRGSDAAWRRVLTRVAQTGGQQ